jgi:hypothetical protein
LPRRRSRSPWRDLRPLEFRKIILIGNQVDINNVTDPFRLRVAFWIPAAKPFRRTAGITLVFDALPFECQALKGGAIVEVVREYRFAEPLTLDEMAQYFMPIWEQMTKQSLGFLPNMNRVPVDENTAPRIQFSAV